MIFRGHDSKNTKFIFGVGFSQRKAKPYAGKNLTHYYLIFYFGHRRFWVGYNRLKRIRRDELYLLDGKKIYYHKKNGDTKRGFAGIILLVGAVAGAVLLYFGLKSFNKAEPMPTTTPTPASQATGTAIKASNKPAATSSVSRTSTPQMTTSTPAPVISSAPTSTASPVSTSTPTPAATSTSKGKKDSGPPTYTGG